MTHLKKALDSIQTFFSGEFDRILIEADGNSDIIEIDNAKSLEFPSKGVSELDRLSHLVNSVDSDCAIAPKGSFKMIPLKEVRRNEVFKGLKKDQAFDLSNYYHFRKVQNRDKKEQIEREDGVYNSSFLDEVSTDMPNGSWNVLRDTTE